MFARAGAAHPRVVFGVTLQTVTHGKTHAVVHTCPNASLQLYQEKAAARAGLRANHSAAPAAM